ncbi:hypothetical protein AKJ63_01455 [candidate division MSBL1 archaeon SCGC-AAA259D18]|uniref:Uncharacterized protein n=1 Tax=candidate division MSBL1 archaeon SCGC-AAA259D18 TaxID=1698262 RepID=A0A133UBA8_9EURY|nr:hypothetical protein AKJ63_01455 [candidate division MSBL1 archaeon SCGC-AAA259D18]
MQGMISQASSYLDCESTCPKVAELKGKIEALKEGNTDLRQEKQEGEKKVNYQKEKYARLYGRSTGSSSEVLTSPRARKLCGRRKKRNGGKGSGKKGEW